MVLELSFGLVSLLSGGFWGLHGNGEVSDVLSRLEPHSFNRCFTEKRKRRRFCRDEVSGWLLSSAEQKKPFSSVCVFVQSECVCASVRCVFKCVSGVLTEALHSKSSLPFGKASLQRGGGVKKNGAF